MSYRNICKLCDHLIISQAVTFADGMLTINGTAPAAATAG